MTNTRVRLGPHWWIPALLLLVAFVVYSPTLRAGYVWDDDAYVTENANLKDTAGLARIWLEPRTSPQYYPLVFTTFWAERHLFGASAASHHLGNVLLHAANAILVWLALRRLRVPGAPVIALVFAAHPVHVESVAWVTERKNVLSGFFCLASLVAYLRFANVGAGETASPPSDAERRVFYVISLLLFAAALLSKSVTATLPAVLLLLLWWKRSAVTRWDVLPLLPMFALGIGSGLLTSWLEVHQVGAAGEDWTLSALGRVLLAGRVVGFYAWRLLWPHPLMFIYPRWTIDPTTWWQYGFPAAILTLVAALWHWRGRLGRGPLVAVLCFIGSLFPVLGFLNVYPMRFSWVADHFQYLPSIAFLSLAVVGGRTLLEGMQWRALGVPIAVAVVFALGLVARNETRKFESEEILWRDTIAKNPSAWIAPSNLGYLRMREGRWSEAVAAFEAAVAVKPDRAEAHNNLGIALFYSGDTARAIESHRKAIQLQPAYAEALNNLGFELASAGNQTEAIDSYRRALTVQPTYAMAHYNLANALARLGQDDAAEREYRAAIRLSPGLAMAHYNLGIRLLRERRRSEAVALLAEAFRLKPDFAVGHYEVANILLAQGDAAAAADSYTRAIERKPDYAEAYSNLGAALMQMGRVDDAIASLRAAIKLRPQYAIAENNLGLALERRDNLSEALVHFQAALRIDPANAGARVNLERLRARTGK